MNKTRQEPVFLLEMPHSLRHMIMRRGLMLRGRRTRTLCCMNKGGSKAWLEAKLIPASGESTAEDWDKAHELASRFKLELHTDVYVEPSNEYGRFKDMTSPPLPPEFDQSEDFQSPGAGLGFGMGGIAEPSSRGVSTPFGGFSPEMGLGGDAGRRNQFGFRGMNLAMPGMPRIPDPMKDLLPPQVRQLIGANRGISAKQKSADLTFRALKNLPGWSDLAESKQMMLEVEAAQLNSRSQLSLRMAGNIDSDSLVLPSLSGLANNWSDERALAALSVHPKISMFLKRFLLESFEVNTQAI